MEFKEFNQLLQDHVTSMTSGGCPLFVVGVSGDAIWESYLDSFPAGTNTIFRKRREFDCGCCKNFIRQFGNVVTVVNNRVVTIWDFAANDTTYQPVVDALAAMIKSAPIVDVFVTKSASIGTMITPDGDLNWNHFYVSLPADRVSRSGESVPALQAQERDAKNVFQRSLTEISLDAVDTVLELIAQGSLYKGDEWQGALSKFRSLQVAYQKVKPANKENFCWYESVKAGAVLSKIKNHSIGVLLVDITQGADLDSALRKYESIVAPHNYKRPKAIYTEKMLSDARNTLAELGLLDSLGRRHATLSDVCPVNMLFIDRGIVRRHTAHAEAINAPGGGDVFAQMKVDAVASKKQQPAAAQTLDRVEEVSISHFLEKILPTASSVEIFVENRHTADLVSLIAPQSKECPSLLKWPNGFSWAYNGNATDSSMKQRVKEAGGKVDGVLRFSLQWNTEGGNQNDFDAHCVEPNGNHIYFPNKQRVHLSTGMLDVDIIHPGRTEIAVENITWTAKERMQEGVYTFYVHNYNHRGGPTGFSAEIEYDGRIYSFDYPHELRHEENVVVAKVRFSQAGGFQFIQSLPHSVSSQQLWGVSSNQFVPVSAIMPSPNYWDGCEIGHKHILFMLEGCASPEPVNGFFNEFLREDLMKHKNVFEALGSRLRVEPTDDQLSGLGFSSTKRNNVLIRVTGKFTRTVKVSF